MERMELRETKVHYCDICLKECGCPYYGLSDINYGDINYGECCAGIIKKLQGRAPQATKELIKFIELMNERNA